jgi:hypothetical protein
VSLAGTGRCPFERQVGYSIRPALFKAGQLKTVFHFATPPPPLWSADNFALLPSSKPSMTIALAFAYFHLSVSDSGVKFGLRGSNQELPREFLGVLAVVQQVLLACGLRLPVPGSLPSRTPRGRQAPRGIHCAVVVSAYVSARLRKPAPARQSAQARSAGRGCRGPAGQGGGSTARRLRPRRQWRPARMRRYKVAGLIGRLPPKKRQAARRSKRSSLDCMVIALVARDCASMTMHADGRVARQIKTHSSGC